MSDQPCPLEQNSTGYGTTEIDELAPTKVYLPYGKPNSWRDFRPNCCYASGNSRAGTQFWDEKMSNELAEGRLRGTAFDRYCMVLFAGIAAEALVYGEAEGGENDENLFRSICLLLQPPLSIAQLLIIAPLLATYIFIAVTLLYISSSLHKDRMDQRPSDLMYNRVGLTETQLTWIFRGYPNKFLDLKLVRTIVVKWYNLVAMNDHGCCHNLGRGGDNNGKAGH
ncbi:hypothetical protein LWI29_016855 [Acer saccharum]|uniref:Uncharacterized protein n=1 Tax=Acer saccharum TaxID=4024 RepID=A0AA39STZ7_ACESA|nr:hypothetical protein LWI29_016855 [Acer saccharum]